MGSVLFESTTPMQQKYFGQLDKYTYISSFIFPNDNQQIWLDCLAHFVCYCVKNAVKWFTELFASPQWKRSNGKILQIHWLLNNCHNYGDTLFKPVPNLMLVNPHPVLGTLDTPGNLTCSNPEADKNTFSVYKREKQSGGEHCKARASKYSCYSNQHLKYVTIDDQQLKKIMWLKALAHYSKNCKKCSFLPYTLELLSRLQHFLQHFHMWATILTTILKEKPLHW